MAYIHARMDSHRSTRAEKCARSKALFLARIAKDLAGWQSRVQECNGLLEDHWLEVEGNAARLHVLRSQILVSLCRSRTLFALKRRAQKAHEQIVDEMQVVEIIEERLTYLTCGVRQCEQALEDARQRTWEMRDGWVAPHIVCPSVEWMRPNG
eukprot:1577393-Rhodomonas_salina.1